MFEFPFVFPRAKFVDDNRLDVEAQVSHLMSEVRECAEVVDHPDADCLAMELMDVMHSAETALRILSEVHGVDLYGILVDCIIKNQKRGYYGEL